MKVILMGNAGAGKSTMARALIGERNIPRLSLDLIAWDENTSRKPLLESIHLLEEFIRTNNCWVIEGCYSDLIEVALPHCDELRFLNPGVDVCVAHCLAREWEPEKFASPEAQKEMVETLVAWVMDYESREDEYGLLRHRAIFEGFSGRKKEYSLLDEYREASSSQ